MSNVYFIKTNENAQVPRRSNLTDAGMDLFSCEAINIAPGARALVSTGLKIGIVPNNVFVHGDTTFVWQAEVRPRSGMAYKNGITVLNSPGTIDAGYRGELKVILCNHGNDYFQVNIGDRIAQLVISRSYLLPIHECVEFPDETSRGEGGFGSSGA